MHILNDEEDDADSNADSASQIEEKKKPSLRRSSIDKPLVKKDRMRSDKSEHVKFQNTDNKNNLFMLANSLKCIPKSESQSNAHIPELDSLTSEENLLEDVEERVIARTRSQAALMADFHQQLQRENLELKNAL